MRGRAFSRSKGLSARKASNVPAHVRKSLAVKPPPVGLAQVVVDVIRCDVADLAVVVDVLEQLLAGQLLAAPHDARRAGDRAGPTSWIMPVLPRNRKRTFEPSTHRVAVLQRRQPEGPVQPGVLVVADSDQGELEQPDDGREHLLARQPGPSEVARHTRPDGGRARREREHPLELRLVAADAPARMVAVLLAAAGVAPGGLDMAQR